MKSVTLFLALIAVIVQVSLCDESADKALLAAAMSPSGSDSVDDVRDALAKGADINIKDEKSGQTALMASVLRGKVDIVKHLLSAGADTSIPEMNGYTPPHGAGFQGRPDIMKVLIDAGLDVNAYHEDGFVPLHRACWGPTERHTETIQVLLEHGVAFDTKSKDDGKGAESEVTGGGKTCMDVTNNEGTISLLNTYSTEEL